MAGGITFPGGHVPSEYDAHSNPGIIGDFVHWLQLNQVARQAFQMFNPATKAGWANIAGSFVGGGDMPEGFAHEMPGQFEPYSVAKAAAGGHMSSDRLARYSPREIRPHDPMATIIRTAKGVNPLRQNDPERVAAAKHAIIERQVAKQLEDHRAMQAMKARRQVDRHLGSVPMAGHVHEPLPEHDYFAAHEFDHHVDHAEGDPRVALVRHLIQRRYDFHSGHNHMN